LDLPQEAAVVAEMPAVLADLLPSAKYTRALCQHAKIKM
jgi:hypothetical protein